MVARRLVRWFTHTVLFALIPLGAAVILRTCAGKLIGQAFSESPEVLFLAIMVSATALGDLSELARPLGNDLAIRVLQSALLAGAVISAILYGSYLYDSIIGPGSALFRSTVVMVSIWLSAVLLALGTYVEVFIGRVEGSR